MGGRGTEAGTFAFASNPLVRSASLAAAPWLRARRASAADACTIRQTTCCLAETYITQGWHAHNQEAIDHNM